MNFRVQVFDRSGNFQYSIGKIGDSTGAMFRPKAVSVDSEGDLYVVDALWGVVQVFNRQGELLYYFGSQGTHAGEFQLPAGCSSTITIASLWWIRSTAAFRYFNTLALKKPAKEATAVRLRILLAGLADSADRVPTCSAQIPGDVLGVHNLGPGSKSPITGARPDACAYCHAPHSGLNTGLWNQKLTTQTYTMYNSNTEKNIGDEAHARVRQQSLPELP